MMNIELLDELIKDFANCLIYAKDKGLGNNEAIAFSQAVIILGASEKAVAPAGSQVIPQSVVLHQPASPKALSKQAQPAPEKAPEKQKEIKAKMKQCTRCKTMIPEWFKYHQACGWTE